MPITLSARANAEANEVAALLDRRGIVYDRVNVQHYVEPRLRVGRDELVGRREIVSALDEIVEGTEH